MDRRDHGLALEICTTALRWKMLLDYHLRPFVREDTSLELRWVLRLTLAQTHILDRIPLHAAVDLGVELAREVGGKGGSGFANAVLRRAMENPLKAPPGDDPDSVAVRHSHPKWLVKRWVERHGLEVAETMMEAGNREPALWVRVRRGAVELPWSEQQVLKTAHDGFFVMPDGFRDQVLASESFRRGDLALQDPASGAAALLLAPILRPGATLLDLCAAPGGKIACLADHGDLEGVKVYAFDRSGFRQRKTVDGFRQKGIEAMVAVADGTCPPFKPGSLDTIPVGCSLLEPGRVVAATRSALEGQAGRSGRARRAAGKAAPVVVGAVEVRRAHGLFGVLHRGRGMPGGGGPGTRRHPRPRRVAPTGPGRMGRLLRGVAAEALAPLLGLQSEFAVVVLGPKVASGREAAQDGFQSACDWVLRLESVPSFP